VKKVKTQPFAMIFLIIVSFCQAGEFLAAEDDIYNSNVGIPQSVLKDNLTLHVFKQDQKVGSYVWESSKTFKHIVNKILVGYEGPVKIYFSPGIYKVDSQMSINRKNNWEIIGSPGSELVFSIPEIPVAKTTGVIKNGDREILVDNTGFFENHEWYQVFQEDKKRDLLQNFKTSEIEKGSVTISAPAALIYFKPGIPIPVGSLIYKQINFFYMEGSNNIKISGFVFDGKNIGEVRGHVNYCGILVRNSHMAARKNKSPLYSGLTIENSHFKNLKGRAVAVYAMSRVVIRNNKAENIAVEVFEIDHMSSGNIINNQIYDSHIGIQINDAYNSLVKGNILSDVRYGITIMSPFVDDWVNNNNKIIENDINFTYAGIFLVGENNKNTLITNNYFSKNERSLMGESVGINFVNNRFE
jgi:parallel beta-helix repeat protein